MAEVGGKRLGQKGLTLFEVAVAVVIFVLVVATVGVFLTKSVNESRLSRVLADVNAVGVALESASLKGDLRDENLDGDYFDDLVKKGYLDRVPNMISGTSYRVLRHFAESGVNVFYAAVECENPSCDKTIKELDKRIDGGDGPSSGRVQWVEE